MSVLIKDYFISFIHQYLFQESFATAIKVFYISKKGIFPFILFLLFHISYFIFHISYFIFHISYFIFHISYFIFDIFTNQIGYKFKYIAKYHNGEQLFFMAYQSQRYIELKSLSDSCNLAAFFEHIYNIYSHKCPRPIVDEQQENKQQLYHKFYIFMNRNHKIQKCKNVINFLLFQQILLYLILLEIYVILLNQQNKYEMISILIILIQFRYYNDLENLCNFNYYLEICNDAAILSCIPYLQIKITPVIIRRLNFLNNKYFLKFPCIIQYY
ncbi:hypothetical protein pb186bvf_002119 [Paramecium bursaria]